MRKITLDKGFQAMSSVYMPLMFSTITSYAISQLTHKGAEHHEITPKNHSSADVHLKATKAFFSSVTSDAVCNDLKSNFVVYKGCTWLVKEVLGNGIDYGISLFDSHDDHSTI